ncbi:MAG: lipid-A-disaccharide synthase [Candidatus Omnitrophica bacterium]|nr:lipid-A-disaccharide synthase [Candidatus Omnitrophota bacterium]
MESTQKEIILIAGEASGDLHGANLAKELKKLDPYLKISGLGGKMMSDSGVEIYHDLTQLAVVGFFEVLRHYREIKKCFDLILKKAEEIKPCAVVLIDYPGFNLRLAKELKKRNIRVIYYISPQVWAWKKNRVKLVKKYVDKMLVIFEFEKTFYSNYGIKVEFVGHPLVDGCLVDKSKEDFLNSVGLKEYKYTIGLLPGSREKEIDNLLPVMLESAVLLSKKFPMAQFLLVKAPTIKSRLIDKHLRAKRLPISVAIDGQYNAINSCDICIVTSGTATLETAIMGKPMVVIYKTSFLTWILAKFFVKIKDIGLVNIVAGKRIVPEFVQFEATASNIARELEKYISNEEYFSETKLALSRVRFSLGKDGANENAAREIINSI